MGWLHKIRHPEIFQGKLGAKHYFEGWYYKMISQDGNAAYAIIPGISLDQKQKTTHAFIQIFNGKTESVQYLKFPIEEFYASPTKFEISIGKNKFSSTELQLDINRDDFCITGNLKFHDLVEWPKTTFSPGIMGWFSFIPFMECRHGLVSANHLIDGQLKVMENTLEDTIENSQLHKQVPQPSSTQIYDFTGGKGYIEKDFGKSFPEAYIWLQSNHFSTEGISLMVSIAKIPSFGMKFTGFLSVFLYEGKIYKFATYTRARVLLQTVKPAFVEFILLDGKKEYELQIKARKKGGALLPSPNQGIMDGRIMESLTSEINIEFYHIKKSHRKLLLKDTGIHGGLEIMATLSQLQ